MLHIRHGLFVAVVAVGVGRLALSTGGAPAKPAAPKPAAHSSTSKASAAKQREHRERAWRDWYNRYHRRLRHGYYYPYGYPPGYTGSSTPTTGPSGGSNNGVEGTAPNPGGNGALFHNDAVNPPAADNAASTPSQPIDPEIAAAVARVKKACMLRPDYQAALADKKAAEDKLSALRPDGQDLDPAAAMPFATAALDASERMAAIELEETTKDAQVVGTQAASQPSDAAAK